LGFVSSLRRFAPYPTYIRLILACMALLLLSACTPPPVGQESFVFGTRVEVQVAGVKEAQARKAIDDVLAEFDRLNRDYHAFAPSKLTELNAAFAAGQKQVVDPEMKALLEEARNLAERSGWRFDPGIGQLIRLWGFQASEFTARLPDAAALAAWRAHPASIRDLRLEGNEAWSANPRLSIDFGGYLKGVALDHAAVILKADGIENALINIGGNVLALGTKNGKPWKIGIQHPREPGPMAILELRPGEAIGTSGDYQRYFIVDGRRYSHLIDPATAEPVQHTESLSILIPPGPKAGTLSDALSKPLFIIGKEKWQAEAKALGIEAVLRVDASGEIEATPAMKARLLTPLVQPKTSGAAHE
jgi:thiamine biosynthesis lipoprotein